MQPFFHFVLLLLISAPTNNYAQKHNIIAYYTGDAATLQHYPLEKITHLIYSFAQLRGDSLVLADEQQIKTAQAILSLKKSYPKLKIMISFGGWSACAPCSDLFADEQRRAVFVGSTLKLIRYYGFDGFDLDWEYPAIEGFPGHKFQAQDKVNFSALVQSLRLALGQDKILSFAAGGFIHYLEQSIDWDKVMPLVDFVNLMTYDLVGGYATVTGHHTPLYDYLPQQESTDKCVQWFLRHQINSSKLIIGAAMYARVWENVTDHNNGLYQKGTFKEGIRFAQFEQYFSDSSGFKYYWDEQAKAPFQYNMSKHLFATFDNEKSILAKTNYVKQHKLGGMMFWELKEDKPKDGLLDVIWKNLQSE